jgi:hypothetical protein
MSWSVYSKVIKSTVVYSCNDPEKRKQSTPWTYYLLQDGKGVKNLFLRMEDSGSSYRLLLVRGCLATGKGKNVIVY